MATLSRLASVPVEEVRGLQKKRGRILKKAGIVHVSDLLLHVPRTYVDRSKSTNIAETPLGEEVTIVAKVKSISMRRPRRNLAIIEAVITDGTSQMKSIWFNQTYLTGHIPAGTEVALSGKVERYKGKLQIKNPVVDKLASANEALTTGRIVPIHPSVGEVSPGVIRRAIHEALRRSQPVPDPLPADLIERAGVTGRDWSIGAIHFPESMDEIPPARRRLAFDELFRLELALALRKRRHEDQSLGHSHTTSGSLVDRFLQGLPYELTDAQRRVLDEIQHDLQAPHAMHRLLQGEVGSGKTVVAVATLLTAVEGGWQGAVMAPTEVLADQHYLAINDLLASAGLDPAIEGEGAALGMDSLFAGEGAAVTMALLTSSRALLSHRPEAARSDVTEAIRSGEVDLVVGTHALIQEGVEFGRLGVAVVDEQHRFGVAQRVQLRDKASEIDPDLLIMTATPIPRTLSMTLYGDLEVSLIDQMPPGRTTVSTRALGWDRQDQAWEAVAAEVAKGRQAFVVCPLVEDSVKVEAASATAEFERLEDILGGMRLGLIHGQLPPRNKEAVMAAFRSGEIDVLVSTTVIEVGIDIPNATVMVIEDADRFGLSQLHQLRGRVGRGAHPGTCFLVSDPSTPEGEARIAAMVETTDGFRLAEEDLRIRGQGTVFGLRQAGMADLRIANILRDFDLLALARGEAFSLVDSDPGLDDHPELAEEIRAMLGEAVEWLFAEARA